MYCRQPMISNEINKQLFSIFQPCPRAGFFFFKPYICADLLQLADVACELNLVDFGENPLYENH